MHEMDHAESAQKLIESFRIYYNFSRENGSIKNASASKSGIKLNLGQSKIENLIRLSLKSDPEY